jgi:hypothetical protein
MTKESPLIALVALSLFDTSPQIQCIRRLTALGALEIVSEENGIEGIQLIRDNIIKKTCRLHHFTPGRRPPTPPKEY